MKERYFIDDEEVSLEEFEDSLDEAIDKSVDVESKFDDYLNDTYDEVVIERTSFFPSEILRALDPEMYADALDEYVYMGLYEDYFIKIQEEGSMTIDGYTFKIVQEN